MRIEATREQWEENSGGGAKIGPGEFLCEIIKQPYYDVTQSGSETNRFPFRVIDDPYMGYESERVIFLEYNGEPSLGSLKAMLKVLGVSFTRIDDEAIEYDELECLGKTFIGVFAQKGTWTNNEGIEIPNIRMAKVKAVGNKKVSQVVETVF